MPSTYEPPSGQNGEDRESASERQAAEPRVEVSDLQRPSRWDRRVAVGSRLLVSVALVFLVITLLLVATPIGPALGKLGARPTPTPAIARYVYPTALPATATPTPYPTPTLVVPALGVVPANCPPGSPTVAFAPTDVIPGVGGSGVWLIAGAIHGSDPLAVVAHATAHLGAQDASSYTTYGWPLQIQVFVQTGFMQMITMTGHDLRTGYPLWIQPDPNEGVGVVPSVAIDPTQLSSGTGDGQWRIWFATLYLPGAGCYTLQARWLGGGWTVHFAAGR